MNKRFLLFAALITVAGIGAYFLLQWYIHTNSGPVTQKDLIEASRRLHIAQPVVQSVVVPMPTSHSVRLAIGALGLPDDDQNRQLVDLVTAELSGAPGLELVERQSFDAVLRELGLSLSGIARAKDAVRVGRLLRAEWFLLGTSRMTGNSNQTMVARIVDGRTGIMRDVGAFTLAEDRSALAKTLAGFVRQCREGASSFKPHTFLGIGTFADVGVNTRQAEFRRQLNAYLTSAYKSSPVTLLEREQVNTLLQEVRLDLAGLTENASTNAPQPMQSAFWLVNGFYQAYESSGHEVEVNLRVNRIFGRTTNFTFRALPGEALFRKIKGAIDATIARTQVGSFAPTRSSEAREQFDMGRSLFDNTTGGWQLEAGAEFTWRGVGEKDLTKRRGYLTEAARAFETVLLLEPENREAKFYLSFCYCDWSIARHEEGVSYLRELADGSVDDQWSENARVALGHFHFDTDPQQAAHWFSDAVNHAGTPQGVSFYRVFAQQAIELSSRRQTIAQNGSMVDILGMPAVEAELFKEVESAHAVLEGKSGVLYECCGLCDFVRSFGTNRQAAAQRVVELLPVLTQKFPDLTPYLLSCAAACQVDTNAPVIAEFRKSLAACVEHPENVFGCTRYFWNLMLAPYNWCLSNNLPSFAVELVEAKRQASLRRPEIGFDEQDKVRLAFAYIQLERWQDALAILEEFGDVNIHMTGYGPWGYPFRPALQAALCRKKLGLHQVAKVGLAALGDACLCLHTPSAFAATPDGLWIAIGGRLLQLAFDLRTNKVINLPIPEYTDITVLCLGPDQLWVGTAGEGLIQYDKATGKCRRMTENDGLLLNHISGLCLQDQTLWIGFGRGPDGGLGWLDLRNGHFSALTPPLGADPLLAKDQDVPDQPPRHPVSSLAFRAPNELWMMAAGRGLCRYRIAHKTWDKPEFGPGLVPRSFVVDHGSLIGGFGFDLDSAGHFTRFEIRECGSGERKWRKLGGDGSLPALPRCFCRDGNDLWFGGAACVGDLDLAHDKVRAIQTIPADSVDHIQVAGGYLWVQYDKHLHKAMLADIR
ncbi:MAG: hypothetical protein ACLQU3_12330 [Limisphaerales bacterium]